MIIKKVENNIQIIVEVKGEIIKIKWQEKFGELIFDFSTSEKKMYYELFLEDIVHDFFIERERDEKKQLEGYIDAELLYTEKFEQKAYRTFVTENGDDIEEMDEYRLYLIRMKYNVTRSETFNLTKRPEWVGKYK